MATVVGGLISMTVSGCGRDGLTVVSVDGYVFHVPKAHLVQGTIPWLPASQSDGLTFIVNPEAPLEQQISVGIESNAKTCHPTTPPASNQLASACAAASRNGEEVEAQNFDLEKVHRDGDPTQWEYRLKGQGTVVASCSALSDDGEAGLCTSLGHYKDLIYSVGLRDSDVEHLSSIRGKVNSLLLSWETVAASG